MDVLLSDQIQALLIKAAQARTDAIEECIKNILRQVLKREPTLADAARLTFLKHPLQMTPPKTTSVLFDMVHIGTITETHEEICFSPAQQ